MGVDTRLIINSKWDAEDIVTVLDKHLAIKAIIKSNSNIHSTYFNLMCDNGRMIHLHFCYGTPLGKATLLSLRADEQAWDMLKGVAEILGGYFNEKDFQDIWEEFRGYFWDEDGLYYHYHYAVKNAKLKDNRDIEGLQQSIIDWEKEIRK